MVGFKISEQGKKLLDDPESSDLTDTQELLLLIVSKCHGISRDNAIAIAVEMTLDFDGDPRAAIDAIQSGECELCELVRQ